MIRIGAILVFLEPFIQRPQAIGVNVNDLANVQEIAPKQGLELKCDLPIRPTEKFCEAVELGLSEEVLRLDFDSHRCRACEAGPLTEILDFETSFVFMEVEDDLVGVRRHTSVCRGQGANAFAVLLHVGITVVVLLLEERRCM